MPSLVFDTCCGCIELRTGCLIIGYINLVAEIILFVAGLVGLLGGVALAATADSHDTTAEMTGGLIMVVSVVLLLIVFFLFAFTIVLLVGLHQTKRGHVKAYLIYSYIFLVISVVGLFASFGGQLLVTDIIKNLTSILVQVYFTLVIRSHYHKMGEKGPQIYNTGAA